MVDYVPGEKNKLLAIFRRRGGCGPLRRAKEARMMRKASLILVVVALLAGRPAHIQAVEIGQDPGRDFGLAVGSVGANLLYTPPKLITALFGLMAGGVTAVATGFDFRSMYAVWVPTVTGTYFLTPAHLE